MKRCPACQRTYTDDQNFCLDDGTTLRAEIGVSYNSADAPTSYPYRNSAAPTEVMSGSMPTSGGMGGAPARPTSPPPQFMQPYPQKRSNAILWFVLGGVVLIGAIITTILLVNRSSGTTSTTTSSSPRPLASPSYSPSSTPTSSSNWQTVDGEGFTVTMPGTPSHDTQTTQSAVGPIPIHLYTLSAGYEGYMAGYSQYPETLFNLSKPEDVFDGAQNGVINNIKGQVVSQRSITMNGNPGREVVGTSSSTNLGFTMRLYIVKPKMFMLFYTQYGADKPMSADGKKFLDSFQLTDSRASSTP
jgi:hypothetical protein